MLHMSLIAVEASAMTIFNRDRDGNYVSGFKKKDDTGRKKIDLSRCSIRFSDPQNKDIDSSYFTDDGVKKKGESKIRKRKDKQQ